MENKNEVIMENKTEEQLIEIVKKDGMQLEFIEEQTEKICLAARKNLH